MAKRFAAGPTSLGPRQRVLLAARDVFLTTGFARSTMDMIAARAGMSKQSLYAHFPGKLPILKDAVRLALETHGAIDLATDATGDVESRLRRLSRSLLDDPLLPDLVALFRIIVAVAIYAPDFASEAFALRDSALSRHTELIRSIVASGGDTAHDDHPTVTRFGGLLLEGSRHLLGTPLPRGRERDERASALVDLFLHGYARRLEDAAVPPVTAERVRTTEAPAATRLNLSADRRSGVLAIARDEFITCGFREGSIDRVVSRAGIGKATLYRHFGDKAGLFDGVVRMTMRDEIGADYDISCPGDLIGDVAALAACVLNRHLRPVNIGISRVLVEEAPIMPELARAYYDEAIASLLPVLTEVLVAHGRPIPDQMAARAFHTLATQAVRFLATPPVVESEDCARLARQAANMFLQGTLGWHKGG